MGKVIEIRYEGMGTDVEAEIFVNKQMVCTITSANSKQNKKTCELIDVIRDHLNSQHRSNAKSGKTK